MRVTTRERAGRAVTTVGLGWLSAGLATACMSMGMAAAQDADATYVRAAEGAQVYNYQDYRGKVIATSDAGDLFRVLQRHEFEIDGRELSWLEVQAPAGMQVWVFGQFLVETGVEGVLRVSGTGVRMRPLPDSSVASFPLKNTLNTGDLVEFVERADPSKPFAEDWIRVNAEDAIGFMAQETTTPVTGEQEMAAAMTEWRDEQPELSQKVRAANQAVYAEADDPVQDPEPEIRPVTKPAASIPEEAYRSLAYGRTLFNNAIKKGKEAVEADFDPAIRAFLIVLDMVPEDAEIADQARDYLSKAEAHQTLAATREALKDANERQQQWLNSLQQQQAQAELKDSVHWGRFTGRGWLESTREGRETRWFLRWSGQVTFEVTCDNGRYDMAQFEGYEIGVRGSLLRARSMATESTPAEEALLDITRIEVISGSSR